MNITVTPHNYEITNHTLQTPNSVGDYIFSDVEAWNKIIINDKEYECVYRTGESFYCGDFNAPSNALEICSRDSDEFINYISEIYEDEFESDKRIQYIIDEISNDFDCAIKTVDDLKAVWWVVRDNVPNIVSLIDDFSDDVEDYEVDEDGVLQRK